MEPDEYARMFALEERHWWYRGLRRQIFRALKDRTQFQRPPQISPPRQIATHATAGASAAGPSVIRCLDAGCGTGMTLTALGQRFLSFGIDSSETALSMAAKRGLPHLARASVEAIPFRDTTLDLIVSADVLYHSGVTDDVGAMREMARCLRPGGLLVLNLPAFGWLRSAHDEAIHTARRYTKAEVERKLRSAGFVPLRVRYWNWLLFAPLAMVRLLRRRSGSARGSDLVALPEWANRALDLLLGLEAHLAALPAPAGLSVIAVAQKP